MRLIDADALYDKYQEAMKRLLSSTNMENISTEAISLLCGSALIKEAPSLSDARLLTIEEADNAAYVWFEITPRAIIGIRRVRLVPVDTTACMVYTFGEKPMCFNTADYNKTWRCWSNKPTVEQSKETKWDVY